jgi:hypothetical protein
MTCGYGDLQREQGENNWYTDQFGGTSGAAAMVAGAAAILQSILIARGHSPLSPTDLRRLLVLTGTPQSGNTDENIGPRPNLRAAIEYLDSNPRDREPVITRTKMKGTKLLVDGESFLAREAVIEIDGIPITKHKYPSAYFLPNGITTRVMTKRDVTAMLPVGVDVAITVFNPSTNRRSQPVLFRRN